MSTFKPTDEQVLIVDSFAEGDDQVIDAGAGTGKTSTLKLLGEKAKKQGRKGKFIAYNKAAAEDAKRSFPTNVACSTAHSLAYWPVMTPQYRRKMDKPRQRAGDLYPFFNIHGPLNFGELSLTKYKLSRLVMDTVKKFCESDAGKVLPRHVPLSPGLELEQEEIASYILPRANKAWKDIVDPNGFLKFLHDHYLKIWALGRPKIDADFLCIDEAQDCNPVLADVISMQTHAQKIMVGDRCQAIYAWRGAVDAMSDFDADKFLVLSQSFRFGPAVAAEANKWLDELDAPLRLKGFDKLTTTVDTLDDEYDALLCRTNAECIANAFRLQEAGKRVAVVGGADEVQRFAESAADLQQGKSRYDRKFHADLDAFENWAQVQEYVEDEGKDMKVMVNLIDTYGTDEVMRIAGATVPEANADVVISTAHRSKGREWNRVKIGNDFRAPDVDEITGEQKEPNRTEMMLAYVATTRAKQVLDRGSLTWIDQYANEREVV